MSCLNPDDKIKICGPPTLYKSLKDSLDELAMMRLRKALNPELRERLNRKRRIPSSKRPDKLQT